jgi:hypothetical protein
MFPATGGFYRRWLSVLRLFRPRSAQGLTTPQARNLAADSGVNMFMPNVESRRIRWVGSDCDAIHVRLPPLPHATIPSRARRHRAAIQPGAVARINFTGAGTSPDVVTAFQTRRLCTARTRQDCAGQRDMGSNSERQFCCC